MKLGSINIFSNNSEKKEIGNLNCINIGGKFDTGHNKQDYKAISKFINNHLKKKTLKKEFEFKLKDKNINDTVNEVKIDKLSNFFVPKNFIPIFPVEKKVEPKQGPDTENIENNKNLNNSTKISPHIHSGAIRLIADCSRALNKNTRFRPSEMDDVRYCINKIAPYTKNGYII